MGCYLKSIAQEGTGNMPGSSITLISTTSREYAKDLTSRAKAFSNRKAEDE